MNKSILFAALAAVPFFSFAQSANTITFRGEVAAQTCSVAVNGNASNPVVLLPTISTSNLPAVNDTAGATEFTVSVSGCDGSASQSINTVFVPHTVTPGGNILNTGTAANVNLQLFDPRFATAFPLTSGGYAAPGLELNAGETSASHNFAVRYVREGDTPVTAGTVIGAVQYSVAYP